NEEGVGLWKMALPNGTPERLTGRERNILGVIADRHRARLLYITGKYDIDIWRMELQAGKAGPQPPARFISSTKVENTVVYSQDGKTIAFNSMRSGQDLLWFCDADGQNPRPITIENKRIGSPTWSPDGRQLAFQLRLGDKASICVMNAEGGQKVRLSDGTANDTYPLWSHDGKWIYFRSDRTGTRELWKMPATGGEPVSVLKRATFKYVESWDGKYLIYSKAQMSPGLWRLDLATGEESFLTKVHNAGYWWSWDVSRRGIYFATCETPLRSMVEFYDFATGKVSLVAKLQTPFPSPLPGLAVSPDERWLCYLQQDLEGDLMLMENVR
ncbi:MAG: TolB family protein, partial [Blastocatellia bacterium]